MLEFDDPHWLTGSISSAENHKGVIDVSEYCSKTEGHYCSRLCTAITPFWFPMEHQ